MNTSPFEGNMDATLGMTPQGQQHAQGYNKAIARTSIKSPEALACHDLSRRLRKR
jgi:hypothetical protein